MELQKEAIINLIQTLNDEEQIENLYIMLQSFIGELQAKAVS